MHNETPIDNKYLKHQSKNTDLRSPRKIENNFSAIKSAVQKENKANKPN